MSATLLNKRKYRNLLSEALPVVIRTEAEYHRLLKIAGELMEKPEGEITEEEGRLLELLAVLIETYEDRVTPTQSPTPQDARPSTRRARHETQRSLGCASQEPGF